MKVSFGQKIPVALTQIQNKSTEEFEPATIYEVDCKDEYDYTELKKDRLDWNFSWYISENMQCKYLTFKHYNHIDDKNLFYVLRNQNNEDIGRIHIEEKTNNAFAIEWLDTKDNNGYRFIGQTLLATVAKEVLNKGGKAFIIQGAVDDAIPFYKHVCRFTDCGEYGFHMDEQQMKDFIARTEKRTNGPIIDLKA